MYPHRIRLRGPWDYEPLLRCGGATEPLPPAGRMTLPCRWREAGLEGFAGRVRMVRRFGQPRQIDPHEHVWLTVAGVDEVADIWLNGHPLGRHSGSQIPIELEITGLLQPRNVLTVEVEARTDQGGLWGEVALEIRAAAFLRSVQAGLNNDEQPRLHVTGEVVGAHEHPLELYVLLNDATVVYTLVKSRPEGEAFHVVSEGPIPALGASQTDKVRVELVNGAVCWYSVERIPDRSAMPSAE